MPGPKRIRFYEFYDDENYDDDNDDNVVCCLLFVVVVTLKDENEQMTCNCSSLWLDMMNV